MVSLTSSFDDWNVSTRRRPTVAVRGSQAGVAALRTLWHVVALEAADARPVRDFQMLDARQEDLHDAAGETVCDKHVRFDAVHSGDQRLEQLLLRAEEVESTRLAGLAEPLLQVIRPGLAAVPADHAEPLDSALVVRRTVLVDVRVHEAADHGDLVGVVG